MTRSFTLGRKGWTMLAVLVPLALLFVWVALRTGPLAPVRVTTAQVDERAIVPALFGIGTVEARYSQRIGPTSPGRVASIAVDVGDRVHPGQLLAVIDPVDLDQRIAAASGSAGRSAAMEQAAAAQLADARARLVLARSEASRAEALYKDGWLTRAGLDQRRQALAAAQASVSSAEANRRAAGEDAGRTGSERAALVEQKANLRLLASRAGLVVRRLAEPGTTVLAGQAVVEVVDPLELWIAARFDQTRAGGIAAGLPARIVLRSRVDEPLKGTVLRVEPLADAQTEELLAKISFEPASRMPPIGELAEVTVGLPALAKALAVPNAAVHRVDGNLGVWALRGGDPEFVPVALGAEDADGWVQVLTGLKSGDRVILHSARPLSSRSRIAIVETLP